MTDPEPLDLAAIRADQVTATTSPISPGGPTDEQLDAWNRAIIRCTEQHLPALLDLVEQQAATIAHYDTALIEAGRAGVADEDGEPTRES
ncbi:hypothetical protein, partial [Embleya sp. NPDC005971]|uniref:hypothetical protein n=1 Tax=Embleya sp. NPDC005971 TaxID=3156724 RepID=UPI0034111895